MRRLRALLAEGRALLEATQGPSPTWQASTTGTYSINPSDDIYPDPAFPFHTRNAREVFKVARDLIVDHPILNAGELLDLAITTAGYSIHDLTPEDRILLRMGIDWVQNGPPETIGKTRSPGAPGGLAGATWVGR